MACPPTVSVVTPSLNMSVLIGETLESVLGQDYPHVEYLVVDGGSTDGTVEVLRRYASRLRWVSEPDAGQAAAINKGWRMTRGEVIAWLNADDLYRPGAIQEAVAFLEAHPDVDMVYGDCDFIDASGRLIGTYPARPWDYAELVRRAVNFVPQPAVFLRRRVLETVGYLNEGLHYAMDFEYWLRLGLRHRVVHVRRPWAAYRWHGRAKSVRDLIPMAIELLRVYEDFFRRPDLPASIRALQAEAMSHAYYTAAGWHFWAGDMEGARRYARSGWRWCPGRFHRAGWKVWLFGWGGPLGLRLARVFRKWRARPPEWPDPFVSR